MKKLICIIMSAIIIIMLFIPSFTICAADTNESKKITEFTNGIADLARKYDSEKEFVTSEGNETGQIQAFSAQNSEEVTDITETEYTLQDFQAARLIVRANDKFDEFGAKEHVSGFEDFHILQYESPEAAMEACTNLQAEKNVTNVAPDVVIDGLQGDISETLSESELNNKKHLCDWSCDRTQSDRLLDYLETQDIPEREIVVALIDSGLDYNHEFFEGRFVRSYFNSSVDGNSDDELDGAQKSHGTAVASVVLDNTPKNVKVSVYKVFNDDLTTTISQVSAGYAAAIKNNPDIINVSITHLSDDSGLIRACLQQAYSKNIPVFACVGNTGRFDTVQLPANLSESIAVSATDRDNTTPTWNTLTLNSDVSAPGQDVIVAISDNQYIYWKGTSFSSPCAAALGAILKWVEPNITVDEIKERLKNTSFDVKRFNESASSQGDNLDNFHSLWDGAGIIQFCNALGLSELAAPEFNLENTLYVGEQNCSIQCADENATILYTTDGTYPALENAFVYEKPFSVTQRTRIRAVAYYENGGYYSRETEITPRIQYIDDDEKFTISDDGIITAYNGTVADLFIPDMINGITVTGIEAGAFDTSTLMGLTLPKGVTEIPQLAFYKNQSLEFISGEGVAEIGESAFDHSRIMYAEFPNAKILRAAAFSCTHYFCCGDFTNVEEIESYVFGESGIISFDGPAVTTIYDGAFIYNDRLETIYLPQCTEFLPSTSEMFYDCNRLISIKMQAIRDLSYTSFEDTGIVEANFPSLEIIGSDTFANCSYLTTIDLPSIVSIPHSAFAGGYNVNSKPRIYCFDQTKNIGKNAFGKYLTSRIEFSHLESAKSLPQTEGCIISMPSTFRECTEDTKGRNYKVYGTKGTYAEQWANENGHTFVEISQDTAVLTPLPEKYTDADGVLTADVIGFNRTYQWYGSFTADNTTGAPIDGATDKDFNPIDYPAYPYYYCVVTSTDVGYTPIEIHTNVTENTTYQAADYTEYNKAVEQANAIDRSLYTDLTELDEALSADISGLSNAQQNIVDEQTAKIKAALDNLVLKPADYSRVNEQINTVPEHLEYYTDKTVNALNEILNGIDYGLDITKQDEVDSYAEQLQNAISALEYKPADYTEYDKAVAKAKGLDKEKYVDFSRVEKELAVDVDGRNITQQEEIDLQTKAILAAIDALEYKSADYTEYDKAVAKAKGLDKEKYVDFSRVEKELAVDVGGRNITQQEEVDLQTKAILVAIDALEEKPQEQPIINPEQDKTNGNTTPDKPSKNESVISPMTGSETYTGVFTALAALSFATVLLVRKKKDN